MNWMRYLLEANLYLTVFYLLYRLLLSCETHYGLSRSYLLFTSVVSFIIPILQLGFLKPPVIIQTAVMVNLQKGAEGHTATVALPAQTPQFSLTDGFTYFYFLGALVFLLLLIVKLVRLSALSRSGKKIVKHGYQLVEIPGSATAFSFFNKLYIGANTAEKETIIRHELVHIHQKHSADIMLMEAMRVVCWFNPVVYLVQNDLKAVHEYMADEKAAANEQSLLAYSAFLVNNAYGIGGPSITQSFFNKNLLKNRIMMLNKKPSGNLARLKYLLTLPLLAALLGVSTLAFSKTYGWVDLAPYHGKTTGSPSLPLQQSKADTNAYEHNRQHFVYKNGNTTSKGYTYKETGYLVQGKTDFRVIITEKNGKQIVYLKSNCTPGEIKMLNEKYGYTFPSMDIFTKLPPPPPAPAPPAKPHGPSAGKLPAPVVLSLDASAPAPPAKPLSVHIAPPPPMAPYLPLSGPFEDLQKYLSRNVLYPSVEFKNRTMGSAVIKFDIDADHKIANANLAKGFAAACDNEALSVLKRFNETIDKAPGTYTLAITFYLNGLKAPEPASATLDTDPSFIGEVIIEMYPN